MGDDAPCYRCDCENIHNPSPGVPLEASREAAITGQAWLAVPWAVATRVQRSVSGGIALTGGMAGLAGNTCGWSRWHTSGDQGGEVLDGRKWLCLITCQVGRLGGGQGGSICPSCLEVLRVFPCSLAQSKPAGLSQNLVHLSLPRCAGSSADGDWRVLRRMVTPAARGPSQRAGRAVNIPFLLCFCSVHRDGKQAEHPVRPGAAVPHPAQILRELRSRDGQPGDHQHRPQPRSLLPKGRHTCSSHQLLLFPCFPRRGYKL